MTGKFAVSTSSTPIRMEWNVV